MLIFQGRKRPRKTRGDTGLKMGGMGLSFLEWGRLKMPRTVQRAVSRAGPLILEKRIVAREICLRIGMIDATPFEVEMGQSATLAQVSIQDDFEKGNETSVLRMLSSMYEIT